MSETDPSQFWISYGSTGTSSGSLNYTTDSGASWSSQVIQIDNTGWLDFHLSLFGLGGELYFTWPGATTIYFRKFNSPAHGNGDRGPLASISGTSSAHRSNVMVQSSGRIWVFTRRGSYPSENVLYHYSDNGGSSWTNGVAFATGANDVRIGSMPYVGGNPALVVLYMDDPRGYEYYLWNGSTFEAKTDHSIYAANMGQVRSFTHNVVGDTTFHLVFGLGTNLYHVWKNYANGTGSWQVSVIDSSPYTLDVDWYPTSVVRGDDLYIFYCRKSSSAFASSMIYYKKWSQTSRSWTDPVLVSTDPNNVGNRDPNTCFHVPESADYIPVFWNSATTPYSIYFSKIPVAPEGTDDGGRSSLPDEPLLRSIYPNPFNGETRIEYLVSEESPVRLTVYDALGRVVGEIVDEIETPGLKSVMWSPNRFASGPYIVRLDEGNKSESKKMIYLK